MKLYHVAFTLLSDATFGRGEGIAGLIDNEVEHDADGLPFLRGRTLKGLLSEEADNILSALCGGQESRLDPRWAVARQALFGRPGSERAVAGLVHFGHAQLPEALRETVRLSLAHAVGKLDRVAILQSLTGVRRQTAVDEAGVPEDGSLRSMRIILRQTSFDSTLHSARDLQPDELALLAATVLAFRRAGTGRNRGRGRLVADLRDAGHKSILWEHFDYFTREAKL